MSTTNIRPHITVGYRCGRLTVVGDTGKRKNGYRIWRCQCDCGRGVLLDTRHLQRGTVTSCGCQPSVQQLRRDLTGWRFGRLLCLEPTEKRDKRGSVIWRCQCDCGKECYAPARQLMGGYKRSCGCLSHPPLKEYVGRRFGQLTVQEYAGKSRGMHQWLCRCDCGREAVVGQTLLQNGKTRSCGCLKAEGLVERLELLDGTAVAKLKKQSQQTYVTNVSGCTGVYQKKGCGPWYAQITFKGKTHFLGTYHDMGEAVRVRKRAEEILFETTTDYYDRWKKRAEEDPAWARANPVHIQVFRDSEGALCLEISPDLRSLGERDHE